MHFRQQALVRKVKYALLWVSQRVALSIFRLHETCKVEIQYLKRPTQNCKKNYVNIKHIFLCDCR